MGTRPVISSLWVGGSLSYLEQLCLKSFSDHGHRVKLYTYGTDLNVPKGVELHDGSEILPELGSYYVEERKSLALGSDKFRYYLLNRTNEIWVDCDAYCLRPLPDVPYIFAQDSPISIASGVLRLPKNSPTLLDLLIFTASDYPVLPQDWIFKEQSEREIFLDPKINGKTRADQMPWATWGPRALTYFLKKNDEIGSLWPSHLLYPFSAEKVRGYASQVKSQSLPIPHDCYSVHFFGSAMRQMLIGRPMYVDNLPLKGSFIWNRLIDHDIDPYAAPLR